MLGAGAFLWNFIMPLSLAVQSNNAEQGVGADISRVMDAPWHSAEPCPVVAGTFLTSVGAVTARHGHKPSGVQGRPKSLA